MGVSVHLHVVMHFCVPAHLLACFFQRGSGRGRDSHEKGSESSSLLSFYLQLRILGLSDHRVQIACALLLRRARSIRSLLRMRSVAPSLTLTVFLWEVKRFFILQFNNESVDMMYVRNNQ